MKPIDYLRVIWRTIKATKHTFHAQLNLMKDLTLVRNSQFFDPDWYLLNNPDVEAAGMDPALHYLKHGATENRNPSSNFTTEEYYALHSDVRAAKIDPLIHYERYGKKEGRAISFAELKPPTFPEGCVEGTWRFDRATRRHGRTAIVASYFGDGRLPETLLYLLRGLKKVVDNIVYVADCPVLPDEVEKLHGLVTVAKFERHCQYDFGSYRRGLEIARKENLLDKSLATELVMMNDSNYGPVFPFKESFREMAERDCDFWGYTGYNAFGYIHISSYFYVFKRAVVDSCHLDEFLGEVHGKIERDKVIVRFEVRLTGFLENLGFKWDTLVPMGFKNGSPTKYPLSICRKYHVPFLKVKAANGDSYESPHKALAFVKKVNPELGTLIHPRPIKAEHHLVSYMEHQESFPEKAGRIAEKLRAGGKAKAVFFVSNASMFPARPLFHAMMVDEHFDPAIVVIPDLRWRDNAVRDAMDSCREDLEKTIPPDRIMLAEKDEFGTWDDILEDADIVCYPSPYELSSFRYNPRYSIGRDFLPICANYGYYRSVYDRHVMKGQSYAYMWKAFFECEYTIAEYRQYSAIGGTNGDLVGYMKMDALAKIAPEPHSRKRVLVALHHSVEGGTNKMLSLANFVRYSDFFLQLPDIHPEIDFVFRPHPFLFTVLSRPNQWGRQRVEKYLAELKAKANVLWSDGGDYFQEFAESDACIQDCGSYLVEYFYTGKPCCYMLKEPSDIDEKFAPLGKKCLENCYIAYDTVAIEAFIRDVVAKGDDPKASARAAFAKTIMLNHPHAADMALQHIKAGLGL